MRIHFLYFLLFLFPICSFGQQDSIRIIDLSSGTDFVPVKYKLLYKSHWTKQDVRSMRDSLEIKSISFKRSGCLGPCPVYNLKFNIDGTAEYNGKRYVNRKGNFIGEISLWDFTRLCYLIDEINFQQLEESYYASWTDASSVTVTVFYKNGDAKKVTDYGRYGPIEFWALTKTIASIGNELEWKRRKQPNSDAAPKSLEDKVDQLVAKDQYEEALQLVNNAKGEDETDKAKLREKVHLNYGLYLEYRGPEGKSMRKRMTSALDQYIKVLRINSKNEKARSEIEQIMGIYETMPSQSPGEKILAELRSLGFEY